MMMLGFVLVININVVCKEKILGLAAADVAKEPEPTFPPRYILQKSTYTEYFICLTYLMYSTRGM